MLPSGFFDVEDRYRKLNERGPLTRLNERIDGENFRDTLNKSHAKDLHCCKLEVTRALRCLTAIL